MKKNTVRFSLLMYNKIYEEYISIIDTLNSEQPNDIKDGGKELLEEFIEIKKLELAVQDIFHQQAMICTSRLKISSQI